MEANKLINESLSTEKIQSNTEHGSNFITTLEILAENKKDIDEQHKLNILNEKIVFDFMFAFKTIFYTFYDENFKRWVDFDMQKERYEQFMEFRSKLDDHLKVHRGLEQIPLHHLLVISKNFTFPPRRNSYFENEFEFPRMTKHNLFKIKEKWTKNKHFLENKLIVTVDLLNFALRFLCELMDADYGEDIAA